MLVTHTFFVKPIVITGFFTAKGALNISGASFMDVHPAGDSIHCTQTMTTKEGSFTMHQDCSNMNIGGSWYITNGTGHYTHLQGRGTLTMRVNGHLWWSKPLKPLIALALKQMKNMNKKSAFIVIVK